MSKHLIADASSTKKLRTFCQCEESKSVDVASDGEVGQRHSEGSERTKRCHTPCVRKTASQLGWRRFPIHIDHGRKHSVQTTRRNPLHGRVSWVEGSIAEPLWHYGQHGRETSSPSGAGA